MTNKDFLKALVAIGACVEAWFEIEDDHHTLGQSWLTTDREDWMVWLCIRVGLWERVRVLVEKSVSPEVRTSTAALVIVRTNTNRHQLRDAANYSAVFDYRDPQRFRTDLRALLTWREIETAIDETIEKESK